MLHHKLLKETPTIKLDFGVHQTFEVPDAAKVDAAQGMCNDVQLSGAAFCTVSRR